MAKQHLVIDNNTLGQFFLLIEEGMITIGSNRNPAETLIRNLRVSRIHCDLEIEGEPVEISSDTGGESSAGTQELAAGEVLHVGDCDLHLEAPDEQPAVEEAPEEPADEPVVGLVDDDEPGLLPEDAGTPVDPVAAATATAVQARPKRLRVVDGADQGRFYNLVGGNNFYIGKDRRNAEIILNDLYVARIHCHLQIDGEEVTVIEDEGGRNAGGMLLNGQKVTSQQMQVGDILRVGNSHLQLELATDNDAEEEEDEVVGVVGEENAAEEEDEVFEVTVEDEDEPLPKQAPEAARQLHEARERLARLTGQVFGHFRLSRLPGRGRCGVVFHALDVKDVQNSQLVALKVLAPQFPQGDQELQRFVRVLKTILPLRHPNLVTLYSAGRTGPYMWIAREHVEGESVAEVLRRLRDNKRPDWRRGLRVAVHVARALDFAREHRLYHGAITPANLLVQKEDRATRLTDLMLAPALEGSQLLKAARASRRPAELAYLAPELLEPGTATGMVSDLFSLGVVVYALLTGRPPFQADSAEELLKQVREATEVEPPRSVNAGIPRPLEKVVLKLLAREPDERYQAPEELLAELEPIVQAQGVEV